MTDIKGVILLTGASGGLGLGIAEEFLKQGYRNLALNYRTSGTKLEALLQKFELPVDKHLFQADLSDEQSVQNLRKNIESKLGKVTSLINLAGASTNGMSWKISLADFRKILDANLTSTFLCSREFVPQMREQNSGRIINVSSVVAHSGAVGASHYSAAKAGIIGLTKSMALELANKGITVNALSLGYFNAGLIDSVPEAQQTLIKQKIPVARFGSSAEIFSAIKYFISEESTYTTGQVMHINGGLYS